jgi:hypothetical protein
MRRAARASPPIRACHTADNEPPRGGIDTAPVLTTPRAAMSLRIIITRVRISDMLQSQSL